jgi:hypothetical protein
MQSINQSLSESSILDSFFVCFFFVLFCFFAVKRKLNIRFHDVSTENRAIITH